LFGIRYLILPARTQPPVPARLTMPSGPCWLWTISGGYVQAGPIVGEISTNRTVRMRQPGVAVLSVSYDPGWSLSVTTGTATTRCCSR